MANSYFRFKQFIIQQDKCAMKVGTDGVLLGAWASVDSCKTILDVGTGTGLIALMLAQRSNAFIDAIEIDKESSIQALENITSSQYANRIRIHNTAFHDYVKSNLDHTYDLLISNPPYFRRSLAGPDNKRNIARHTDSLSYNDLITEGKKLLKPKGHIALILPYEQLEELKTIIHNHQMYLIRQTTVYPKPRALPKRVLVEISSKYENNCIYDDLTIELSRHVYTETYRKLTKDFYFL